MNNDVVWLSFKPRAGGARVKWETVANAVEALSLLAGALAVHILERQSPGETPSPNSPLTAYLVGSPRVGSLLVPVDFSGTPELLAAAKAFAEAVLSPSSLSEARKFLVDVSTVGSFVLAILLARTGLLAGVQRRSSAPETPEEAMVEELLDGYLVNEVAGTVQELYASVRYSDCEEVEITYREFSFRLIHTDRTHGVDMDDEEADGSDEPGDPLESDESEFPS